MSEESKSSREIQIEKKTPVCEKILGDVIEIAEDAMGRWVAEPDTEEKFKALCAAKDRINGVVKENLHGDEWRMLGCHRFAFLKGMHKAILRIMVGDVRHCAELERSVGCGVTCVRWVYYIGEQVVASGEIFGGIRVASRAVCSLMKSMILNRGGRGLNSFFAAWLKGDSSRWA